MDGINWDVDAIVENIKSQAYQYMLKAAEEVRERAEEMCPVKTGRLRDSIVVTGNGSDSVTVGSDLPYAADVEFGHVEKLKNGAERHVPASPYLTPALEEVRSIIIEQGLEAFK